MHLDFKCSDLRRTYEIRTGLSFKVQDYRDINKRIVVIFYLNGVPIISTYIDTESLNIHGFAYESQKLSDYTIELTKEITNKIKNVVIFEHFEVQK